MLLLIKLRMKQAMERLMKLKENDYSILTRVLFGFDPATPVTNELKELGDGQEDVKFHDLTLNDSQKDAVRFSLASHEVALIHGPPGVSTHVRSTAFTMLRST